MKKISIKDKQIKSDRVKSAMSSWMTWFNTASSYLWNNTFINKQQLYELYRNNTDIRQWVRKIAQYVWLNGIKLRDSTGEYPQEEDIKVLKDEVFFSLSNPTYMNTKIEIIKHLVVSWELYLLPTYSPVQVKGKNVINWFQCLDPRTINPIFNNGVITWFTQSMNIGWTATGRTFTADPDKATDQIPLLKFYILEKHINNELRGMWLLEWIVWDAMSDLEASKRNFYFFQNDMTPPSIIMVDPDLSPEEQDILLDQLKEQYSTPKNAHKPLMWIGVKDVKQLSISPKDMEHIKQRQLTTEKVCSAIGVPKVILWYVDNINYANGDILSKEFIEWTIRPRERMVEHVINDMYETYMPDFEYFIEVHWLWLEDTTAEKELALKELTAWTLTLDEFRMKFERDPYAIAWYSDVPQVPKWQSLLTDIGFDFWWTWFPT